MLNLAKDADPYDDIVSLGDKSEEGNTTGYDDFTNLRSDILKALGGNEVRKPMRAVQSAVNIKAQRPQSQGILIKQNEKRPSSNNYTGARKGGLYSGKKSLSGKSVLGDKKYQLNDLNELFDDSSVEGLISLEENLLKSEMQNMREKAPS